MLSQLPNNSDQDTTHETTSTTETISNLYNIKEMPEGTFPLYFNPVDRYQREYPFLRETIKHVEYTKGFFRRGRSTIDLITYKDKIFILQKQLKYVVKWYHTYLLHTVLDLT